MKRPLREELVFFGMPVLNWLLVVTPPDGFEPSSDCLEGSFKG